MDRERLALIADIVGGIEGQGSSVALADGPLNYEAGAPCKTGETAASTDCIPASGEAASEPKSVNWEAEEKRWQLHPETDEEIDKVWEIVEETRDYFRQMLDEVIADPEYRDGFMDAIKSFTVPMLLRVKATIGRFDFYESLDELTEFFEPGMVAAKTGKRIGGVYMKQWDGPMAGKGVLHLDGGGGNLSQHGIYTHELGHAIDNDNYSQQRPWEIAWRREIKPWKGTAGDKVFPLSQYATTNASEGFAEFFRLMNSQPASVTREEFPMCWRVWKEWGFV